MGFDTETFENTTFKDRVEDIPVPNLKKFFGDDEKKLLTDFADLD